MSHRSSNTQTWISDGRCLDFAIQPSTIGTTLFTEIIRLVGLKQQDSSLFGIQFTNSKTGQKNWLEMSKKISKEKIKLEQPFQFHLRVKFLPENLAQEFTDPLARSLLFHQIKKDIEHNVIQCNSEVRLLLADYEGRSAGDSADLISYLSLIQTYFPTYWNISYNVKDKKGNLFTLALNGLSGFKIQDNPSDYKLVQPQQLGWVNLGKQPVLIRWSEIRGFDFNQAKFIIKMIDKKIPDYLFFFDGYKDSKQFFKLAMEICEISRARGLHPFPSPM